MNDSSQRHPECSASPSSNTSNSRIRLTWLCPFSLNSLKTKICGIGDDADAAKVKAVGVPASGDGKVFVMTSDSVVDARVEEEVEVAVGQVEELTAKGCGQCRTARTVFGIVVVVLPAAIVKQREEPDDRDDRSALASKDRGVALDAPPVIRAVDGVG